MLPARVWAGAARRCARFVALTLCGAVVSALASPGVALAQEVAPRPVQPAVGESAANADDAYSSHIAPGDAETEFIDLRSREQVTNRIAEISSEIELLSGRGPQLAAQVVLLRREQELLALHERVTRHVARLAFADDLVAYVRDAREEREAARSERAAVAPKTAVAHLSDEATISGLQSRVAGEFERPLVEAREQSASARGAYRALDGELAMWAANFARGMRELASELELLRGARDVRASDSSLDPNERMEDMLRVRLHAVSAEFQRFWLVYLQRRRPSLPSLLEGARLRVDAAELRLGRAQVLYAAARAVLRARLAADERVAQSEIARLESAASAGNADAMAAETLTAARLRHQLAHLRLEVERIKDSVDRAAEYQHIASEAHVELAEMFVTDASSEVGPSAERRGSLRVALSPPIEALPRSLDDVHGAPIDVAALHGELAAQVDELRAHFDRLRAGAGPAQATRWTEMEFEQRDLLGSSLETLDRAVMLDSTIDEFATVIATLRSSTQVLLTRGDLRSRVPTPYTLHTLSVSMGRLRRLPEYASAAVGAVRRYLSDPGFRATARNVLFVSCIGIAMLLLLRRRVARGGVVAGSARVAASTADSSGAEGSPGFVGDTEPAAPTPVTHWRVRRAIVALLGGCAAALPFAAAALVLPSLPADTTEGLFLIAACLGSLVAGEGLASAAMGEGDGAAVGPPTLPEAPRRLLRSGARALLWASAGFLLLAWVQRVVFVDAGGAEVVLGAYKLAVVVIILTTIARKSVFAAVLPAGADARSRSLRGLMLWLHPVLFFLVPGLFVLDVLGYGALAGGITKFVVSLIVASVAGQVVYRVVWNDFEQRFPLQSQTDPILAQRAESRAALVQFALFTTVAVLMVVFVAGAVAIDAETLRRFLDVPLPFQSGDVQGWVTWWNVIVGVTIITLFIWLRANVVMLLRDVVLPRSSLKADVRYTITVLFGYVWLVAGVLLGVAQVVDLSALGYVLTGLSVGIGFGMQQIVADFLSGLILLFERPLRVGDVVELDGKPGVVKEIALRSTTVQTLDNISLLIPNRRFIEEQVINYEHGDPVVRMDVAVGVAYGSDRALVERLLLESARKVPAVLRSRAPSVVFDGFGDSSLNFILVVWIAQVRDKRQILSAVRDAIDDAFRAHGVTIPFPQRDVHIDGAVARAATDRLALQGEPAPNASPDDESGQSID